MIPSRTAPRGRLGTLVLCAVGGVLALAFGAGERHRARGDPPVAPAGAPEPPAAPPPRPDPPPAGAPAATAPARAWLDDAGTAVLGFGLLRVAPAKAGVAGTLHLRYEEKPTGYAAFDDVQLVVLPGTVFEANGSAFADRCVAFSRSAPGSWSTEATVAVAAPALLGVGFGPFTGPDTGRPLGLGRAYTLEVTAAVGVAWRWVDAEAGEWNVKGWTNRPEVRRGGPVRDPVTGADHWFEVRPQIVYDRDRIRAAGDPESPETAAARREAESLRARADALDRAGTADAARELRAEADVLLADAAASDGRLPLPRALAERFRRLPFRWK